MIGSICTKHAFPDKKDMSRIAPEFISQALDYRQLGHLSPAEKQGRALQRSSTLRPITFLAGYLANPTLLKLVSLSVQRVAIMSLTQLEYSSGTGNPCALSQ